jgi:hypothetical protein
MPTRLPNQRQLQKRQLDALQKTRIFGLNEGEGLVVACSRLERFLKFKQRPNSLQEKFLGSDYALIINIGIGELECE